MMASMITTEDNPYDPRTHFTEWNAWDINQGYCTTAYLARVGNFSDDLPEAMIDRETEDAIDEIIAYHANGLYKKLPIDDAA